MKWTQWCIKLTTYPSAVQLITSHLIVMFPFGSSGSYASEKENQINKKGEEKKKRR